MRRTELLGHKAAQPYFQISMQVSSATWKTRAEYLT